LITKENKQLVIAIGGATASGKSGLALTLAQKLNGVILNYDSLQLYDGLPILTAQPSDKDYATVEHRLYSFADPKDSFSAVKWRSAALKEIDDLRAENKTPILVGGTGFYIKTLLEGLSPIPEADLKIRETLIEKHHTIGGKAFFEEFALVDSITSANLDPANTQRVIRAWEVLLATGKPLAEWQKEPLIAPPEHLAFYVINLMPPREILYHSCNTRFEKMLDMGGMEEVTEFKHKYEGIEVTLNKALGYKELCYYLDNKITLKEAIEKAQQATRNYAKRQTTWFNNQIKANVTLDTADKGIDYIVKTVFDL